MSFKRGGDIFYDVLKKLDQIDISENRKVEVIKSLIDALESADWDGVYEYMHYPLVKKAVLELHPNWYEESDDETEDTSTIQD